MVMRRNPQIERYTNGTLYGIDQDGNFSVDQSTRLKGVPMDDQLEKFYEVSLESEPTQVLLWLDQREIATLSGEQPQDQFSVQVGHHKKSFFRTGFSDDVTIRSTYTAVETLLQDSSYHTTELLHLIRYIPHEQLGQFGVSCLKKIVK